MPESDRESVSTNMTQTGEAFERIDLDQHGSSYPLELELHVARYRFAASWARAKRVLDIACGTGYGAAILAQQGAAEVHGVDIDAATIDRARQQFPLRGVTFSVGDAEQPPVDGPFDLIVSFETIEHVQQPERLLRALHQRLNPRGILIVSTPCRQRGTIADRPANPFHVREWNRAEFEHLLGEFFAEVQLFGQLIEFTKNWLPLNRTLARLSVAVLAPSRLPVLSSPEVSPLPPFFRSRMVYVVAVCRKPQPAIG